MAPPFATASDLAARLKRPVWDAATELDQVETLLADASNDLRAEIGWQVYPPVAVTVDADPDLTGHIRLPGSPIVSVQSVSQYGAALSENDYEWSHGLLHLGTLGTASVTYTVGYVEPPAELLKWSCVLAAQALAQADRGSLGVTPSSESLGSDYRVSYSDRQQAGELLIPARVLERLRSSYGQAVFVT